MSDTTPTGAVAILRARADARRARQRLTDDVAMLRHRLSPSVIASDAVADARKRVVTVAGDAADMAQTRPAMIAGGVAAAGALLAVPRLRRALVSVAGYLLRNPKLLRRLLRRR